MFGTAQCTVHARSYEYVLVQRGFTFFFFLILHFHFFPINFIAITFCVTGALFRYFRGLLDPDVSSALRQL